MIASYYDGTSSNCAKCKDQQLQMSWSECVYSVFFCFVLLKAVDHLESFIAECDRRTELAKKRLAETQEEISAEVAAKVSDEAFFWKYKD